MTLDGDIVKNFVALRELVKQYVYEGDIEERKNIEGEAHAYIGELGTRVQPLFLHLYYWAVVDYTERKGENVENWTMQFKLFPDKP